MMKRFVEKLLLLISTAILVACNISEEFFPPKITLDNGTGIYTVKYGRELVITPTYEHIENATFCWIMDGEVLATSPTLSFSKDEVGEYYITLTVSTDYGTDEEELRVDVVELEIPTVSIAGNKKMTVAVGTEVRLNASVRETSLPTTLVWSVNDNDVSVDYDYTFVAKETGNYVIKATASNADGSHSDMVEVEVLNADDIPFTWEFEKYAYHTVVGRKLVIKPLPSYEHNVDYSWNVEEIDELTGSDSYFVFLADEAGSYHINAVATTSDDDNQISMTRTFVVTVYGEKDFYRPKNGASQADWNKVIEYTPAPGQFINELKTGGFDASHVTPEAAVSYAESRLMEGSWVSLGGFGGYVIVGFDHSIDNSRTYDFGIISNAFDGSSEPGVVWVMQDENGNGYPDDTWYELAGSETGKFETYRDYAVTYYRPSAPKMPV
ncbi:MAG: PKD domain-containing protein, partial [Bacteroidales bacterium]|nr:PKD domain-containing protein [Bacteroidales bacterium]